MPQDYAYAVMGGNEAPDQDRYAVSCHHTLDAARRERDRRNRADASARYYAVEWGDGRWAKVRPSPSHDGAIA